MGILFISEGGSFRIEINVIELSTERQIHLTVGQ
jgi:hypothetical protein